MPSSHRLINPVLPYSRKLLREKTFANFTVLWLFAKVFPRNLGAWHSLAQQKWAIRENFLSKNRFFSNLWKFLPQKFPAIWYILRWSSPFYLLSWSLMICIVYLLLCTFHKNIYWKQTLAWFLDYNLLYVLVKSCETGWRIKPGWIISKVLPYYPVPLPHYSQTTQIVSEQVICVFMTNLAT